MSIESIVLVIALFGSAKVAFDMLLSVSRRFIPGLRKQTDLEKAVVILEGLSTANEILMEENNRLKTRIAMYETK